MRCGSPGAIHPLPEDVTGHTTVAIVQKVRCEGFEALNDITLGLLRRSSYQPILDLADRIEAGEISAPDFLLNPKNRPLLQHLAPGVLPLLQAYTLTAATFDFEFMITEVNDHQAVANFSLPLTSGLFTLGGVSAGARFDRQGDRKFQITNSFYELHKLGRAQCDDITARVGNIVYPITGKIGLEEVFETFIHVDSTTTLTSSDANRFTDELTFTTTLSSGAAPKIALNPGATNQFRLADASLTVVETRTDVHKVTIALAKGPFIASYEQARLVAKKASKLIADQRRTEDFFIIPRDKVIVISPN